MSNATQYAVVSFTILALVISIFYAENLQKSKKKHMIAGSFILLAAFMYALMIVLDLKI